jgi:hypothetical protein
MRPVKDGGLSAPHTARGHLQRELLKCLDVHEREGMLPTSNRFLFYELEQLGVVSKIATRLDGKPGKRRSDQGTIDALTHLREAGLVPWDWIEDETRTLHEFATAPSVAEYVADAVQDASLDRWGGEPAPLILCESRSLAGVLSGIAARYASPIAATNGQARGFLITKVAPALLRGQRVLYLGDWDHCGHQIEAATRRTLVEHSGTRGLLLQADGLWERVALTTEQVDTHGLRSKVISKADRRYKPTRYFDAVETEAFGQANIVAALRDRLDELMPEPIGDVLEREEEQRTEVAEQLRRLQS